MAKITVTKVITSNENSNKLVSSADIIRDRFLTLKEDYDSIHFVEVVSCANSHIERIILNSNQWNKQKILISKVEIELPVKDIYYEISLQNKQVFFTNLPNEEIADKIAQLICFRAM